MLTERQRQILNAIIETYVETAQPIASRALVNAYDFGVSSATIRNEMARLEDLGYIRQPHTSSGRVPTEKGYRLYLRETMHQQAPIEGMNAELSYENAHELVREITHCLMRLSGETALASLETGWSHYSGISQLFSKPEFEDIQTLRLISNAVDKFDVTLRELFPSVKSETNVWMGQENPFNKQMAAVMVKYTMSNGVTGILGLVGPMRMNYRRNIKLLEQARDILESQ